MKIINGALQTHIQTETATAEPLTLNAKNLKIDIYYGEQILATKEKMLGYILRVLDGVTGALDGMGYFELAKDELGLVEENSILVGAVNH